MLLLSMMLLQVIVWLRGVLMRRVCRLVSRVIQTQRSAQLGAQGEIIIDLRMLRLMCDTIVRLAIVGP